MAKTEFVFVSGKVKWFKPNVVNPWGKWAHVMYPDPPSLEKIRELQAEGIKNVVKKDEDGYNIAWSRPCEVLMKTGKRIGLRPPEVLLHDGTPFRDELVGNGSDVTTKLEVYVHGVPGTTQKAKAARWLSSRIDNLVPFVKERDFEEDEKRAIKKLEEQPTPLF